MKCIIIGNGESAIKNDGKIIDSFDKVVRLNNFETVGYEEFVGTKTDLLFTCTLENYSVKELSKFPEIILALINNEDGTIDNNVLIKTALSKNISDVITWTEARILGEKVANIEWNQYFSTGLLAIYYMIFIKEYDVTITGFDNFIDGRSSHYFEPNRQNFPSRHNGEKEKKYIEILVRENKLKIL